MATTTRSKLEEIFYQIEQERLFIQRTTHYNNLYKMLKELYTDKISDLIYKDNPFLTEIDEKSKK